MDAHAMKQALAALDRRLDRPTKLLIGGGAAMVLAHGMPLATQDIDGLVYQSALTQAELDPLVKAVARELHLPADWLNAYFNTFLYTLPADFKDRLCRVHAGKQLTVYALSVEDLLILKCFAGRPKDVPHARVLYRKARHRALVDAHLQRLVEKNVPGAREAWDFYAEIEDAAG
ncbi:MAG: hypothetical protein HY543_00725 [Deltaproteobacteria bacterium]|nr:hypothetical protein [Deltaproteobacteria bacterium]